MPECVRKDIGPRMAKEQDLLKIKATYKEAIHDWREHILTAFPQGHDAHPLATGLMATLEQRLESVNHIDDDHVVIEGDLHDIAHGFQSVYESILELQRAA